MKTIALQIRISETEKREIEKKAEGSGLSQSAWIRLRLFGEKGISKAIEPKGSNEAIEPKGTSKATETKSSNEVVGLLGHVDYSKLSAAEFEREAARCGFTTRGAQVRGSLRR